MSQEKSSRAGPKRCDTYGGGIRRRRRAFAGLAIALVLVSMTGAASAESWYLTARYVDEGEWQNVYYMYEYNETHPTTGSACNNIAIPDPGDPLIWISNESAQVNVTFPPTCWNITIAFAVIKLDNLSFSIGSYHNETDTFTPVNTTYIDPAPNGNDVNVSIEICTDSFTINEGDYLAFNLVDADLNTSGDAITVDVCYSTVTYPPDGPDWPIPELSTLVLMSAGLLALFGYIRYRKRT